MPQEKSEPDRIRKLENALKEAERRVAEMLAERDQALELVEQMKEHVSDVDALIDSWIEAFEMQLSAQIVRPPAIAYVNPGGRSAKARETSTAISECIFRRATFKKSAWFAMSQANAGANVVNAVSLSMSTVNHTDMLPAVSAISSAGATGTVAASASALPVSASESMPTATETAGKSLIPTKPRRDPRLFLG